MSHPTLSGFFPTQTYLVPFILCTNLQINSCFIAFCWACLQFAEAFLPAASRAHPSLVADPRASLHSTQTHRCSWVWGEKCHGFGLRVEKRQSCCLGVLQKGCVPTPAPSQHHRNLQPSGQKTSSHKTEAGEMGLDVSGLPGDHAGSTCGSHAVIPSWAKPSTRLPLPQWGFFCHR